MPAAVASPLVAQVSEPTAISINLARQCVDIEALGETVRKG
jgi:hypothetical protein